MAAAPPHLTIGQVAHRAGVRTSHIRFYERVGVLPQPERVGGERRYGEDILHRLSIVDVAQRAGFSLDEIARINRIEGTERWIVPDAAGSGWVERRNTTDRRARRSRALDQK